MPLVDQNTVKIQNAIFEPEPFDFANRRNEKHVNLMWQFLQYKGITKDRYNFIALKDGTYADIQEYFGRGVRNLTNELSNDLVIDAGEYFNSFESNGSTNMTHVVLSLPVTTQEQQATWQNRLNKVKTQLSNEKDERKIYQLTRQISLTNEELEKQRNAERKLWNQHYFKVLFADTKEELIDLIAKDRSYSSERSAPFKSRTLTRVEKRKVLRVMNNMNEAMEE